MFRYDNKVRELTASFEKRLDGAQSKVEEALRSLATSAIEGRETLLEHLKAGERSRREESKEAREFHERMQKDQREFQATQTDAVHGFQREVAESNKGLIKALMDAGKMYNNYIYI